MVHVPKKTFLCRSLREAVGGHVATLLLAPKADRRLGLLGTRARAEMVGDLPGIASARGRRTTARAEIPGRDPGNPKNL